MKSLIITCVTSGPVVVLWMIGRLTFIFRFFSMTGSASPPAPGPGRFFFASGLKKPRRFDHLCYRVMTPEAGPVIRTYRLCGIPGDTIEIRAGILYVNGRDEDKDLSLMHMYKVDKKDSPAVLYERSLSYTIPPYPDTIYVPLEDNYVRRSQLPCVKYILPRGIRDQAIFQVYKKNWNRDHFGPLRVPAGKFFVLGDNRENVLDSRYSGFIEQSKCLGTVLWK